MKTRTRPAVLTLLFTILAVLTGRAADHTVYMTSDWTFSPSNREIQAGDTVTWYNNDPDFFHDATSDTALWSTGVVDTEESATLQFDTPGTYPYHDSLISTMTGTITVNAVSVPPPALIIFPAALTDGSFRFTISNLTAGKTNVVEVSTNLLQWSSIATNVPAGDTLDFTNAPATGPRFFRSWQQP
jgi:plastocyanin